MFFLSALIFLLFHLSIFNLHILFKSNKRLFERHSQLKKMRLFLFTLAVKVAHQTRQKVLVQKEASLTEEEPKQGTVVVPQLFQEQVEVQHQFELEATQTTRE